MLTGALLMLSSVFQLTCEQIYLFFFGLTVSVLKLHRLRCVWPTLNPASWLRAGGDVVPALNCWWVNFSLWATGQISVTANSSLQTFICLFVCLFWPLLLIVLRVDPWVWLKKLESPELRVSTAGVQQGAAEGLHGSVHLCIMGWIINRLPDGPDFTLSFDLKVIILLIFNKQAELTDSLWWFSLKNKRNTVKNTKLLE